MSQLGIPNVVSRGTLAQPVSLVQAQPRPYVRRVTPAEGTTVAVATYDERPADKSTLPPQWLIKLGSLPPSQRGDALLMLTRRHLLDLLSLSTGDSEALGEACADSLSASMTLAKAAAQTDPAHPAWLSAFVRGFLKKSPHGSVFVRATSPWLRRALVVDIGVEGLTESEKLRVLETLVASGDTRAMDLLERSLLEFERPSSALSNAIARLRVAGAAGVLVLCRDGKIQAAVNLTVGMMETMRATGAVEALDRTLASLDARALPIEVVLAFLTSAKRVASDRPGYQKLIASLEATMLEQRRADASAILSFLR